MNESCRASIKGFGSNHHISWLANQNYSNQHKKANLLIDTSWICIYYFLFSLHTKLPKLLHEKFILNLLDLPVPVRMNSASTSVTVKPSGAPVRGRQTAPDLEVGSCRSSSPYRLLSNSTERCDLRRKTDTRHRLETSPGSDFLTVITCIISHNRICFFRCGGVVARCGKLNIFMDLKLAISLDLEKTSN